MTDPRVLAVLEEFGIEIVPANRYPGIKQTRAVSTMQRIFDKYGPDHFRFVIQSIAETENNYAHVDEYLLWAVSDLVLVCKDRIEKNASLWFEALDLAPVGQLQFEARKLPGSRYALVGQLYERIERAFREQEQLFDG